MIPGHDPGGDAHQDGVHPQPVALPVEQADDEGQFHERIDNVHQGDGNEPFMDGKQALEGDVGDAEAGDEGGYLEDEHGVGLLPREDIQVVVDVPQADGFQDGQQKQCAAYVDDMADVEHPVRVAAGLAHLDVHEADRRRGERARNEGDEGHGAADGAVEAHVVGS